MMRGVILCFVCSVAATAAIAQPKPVVVKNNGPVTECQWRTRCVDGVCGPFNDRLAIQLDPEALGVVDPNLPFGIADFEWDGKPRSETATFYSSGAVRSNGTGVVGRGGEPTKQLTLYLSASRELRIIEWSSTAPIVTAFVGTCPAQVS